MADLYGKDGERLTTRDIAASGDRSTSSAAVAEPPQVIEDSHDQPQAPANPAAEADASSTALFPADKAHSFRGKWDSIQTGFVDEPRRAVEQADSLVAEVMKRLADGFAREREQLERQWDRGDKISTEDLRLALRRYRSFFERLLKM